jgi:SUN domain-containing protein 1/2
LETCCHQQPLTALSELTSLFKESKNIQNHLEKNFVKKDSSEIIYKDTIDRIRSDLMPDILKKVGIDIAAILTKATLDHQQITSNNNDQIVSSLTKSLRTEVRQLVHTHLIQYDADKTGLFDYAMETAGASVVNTRCTETYTRKTAAYSLFGIPLWFPFNNPRTAIQPGVLPGECWAFKGTQGFLVIELSRPMRPTQFSMEHIPRELSPSGKTDSAPKDFKVLGLISEHDNEPVHLGTFSYNAERGEPVQYFPVTSELPEDSLFSHVELVITSNHGNLNYTCLYRFRVHGAP